MNRILRKNDHGARGKDHKRKQVEQEYNGKGEDKKNKFDFEKELKNTLPPEHQTDAQRQGGGDEEEGGVMDVL